MNSTEPPSVRLLGRMERSLWFCDQCSPTNIGFACELQGPVPDESLRRALRWCQIRHPMLRAIIRPAGKALALAAYAPEAAPAIPLEIRPGTEAEEDSALMDAMRQPLAAGGGLMIRAHLLRTGERRVSLGIVFSHVIGDGFSVVVLVQDLVEVLGRLAAGEPVADPEPLPFPAPAEEGIAKEHRGWGGFKKLMAVNRQIAADLKRLGAKPSPVRIQANPPWAELKVQCRSFALTEAETRALVARARREGVSTFALLAASLADAIRPLLEPAKQQTGADRVVSFAAPVDLRPFLTGARKDQFGFYSAAINQLELVREAGDLPALAKGLHTALKRDFLQKKVHLHTSPLLADFLSWRWLFPLSPKGVKRVAKLTAGMFRSCATSLAFLNDPIRIDDRKGIRMTRPRGHIAPSIMGAGLVCAVLYRDVLSVALNYNAGQLADADAAELNARFRDNLVRLGVAGAGAAAGPEETAGDGEDSLVLNR